MSACQIIVKLILLGIAVSSTVTGQTIDCQRPPKLVDPAMCCRDGGRDQNAEMCARKILGTTSNPPSSLEAATCLADCILTNSKYKQDGMQLNLSVIKSDLTMKFSNDTGFVEAMTAAYTKCEPHSQRRLAALQQFNAQQSKCSPFSAIVLGCTYMEYFKNCPAHRWTQNAECALAKSFVTQCGLGA